MNHDRPQKSKRAIRIGGLLAVFIITMFIAPKVLTAFAGPSKMWSGSLGILFLIPEVATILWVFFSIVTSAIFRRGSSLTSVARCIGIGFALAIIGTIVTFCIYNIPPYGSGP